MQVFKNYFKILKNNKSGILIYVLIFTAMTILFGLLNTKETDSGFEDVSLSIAFVNQDTESPLINGLYNYLDSYYSITKEDYNPEYLKDSLFYEYYSYVLIIPEGFSENFVLGKDVSVEEMTAYNANYANYAQNKINTYLSTARSYFNSYPLSTQEEIIILVENTLNVTIPVELEKSVADTGTFSFLETYMNFFVYVLLAMFTSTMCTVIISYQKTDVKRRNLASPISLKSIQTQLFFGNIVFAITSVSVLMIIGFIIHGDFRFTSSYLLLVLNGIVFALCATSIAFLISQFSLKKEAYIALSNVLSLGLSFISGAFVPQFLLSDGVLTLARFTPAYWFVKVNSTIAETSVSSEILKNIIIYIGIQILFALALFSIAISVAKSNSRKAP